MTLIQEVDEDSRAQAQAVLEEKEQQLQQLQHDIKDKEIEKDDKRKEVRWKVCNC